MDVLECLRLCRQSAVAPSEDPPCSAREQVAGRVGGEAAAALLATVVEVETAPRKRKRPSVLDRRPSESVGVHLLGVDLRALNGTTAMEATLLYGIEEVS